MASLNVERSQDHQKLKEKNNNYKMKLKYSLY
jgi:hypothetical protein